MAKRIISALLLAAYESTALSEIEATMDVVLG